MMSMLILVIIIILGYPLWKKLLGLEKITYFFGFKTTEKGIHLLVLLNEMHNSGWERNESRLILESSVPIVHNKNVQQLWLFSVYVPCKFNYNWYTSSLSMTSNVCKIYYQNGTGIKIFWFQVRFWWDFVSYSLWNFMSVFVKQNWFLRERTKGQSEPEGTKSQHNLFYC